MAVATEHLGEIGLLLTNTGGKGVIEVLPLHGTKIASLQQLLEGGGVFNAGLGTFSNCEKGFPRGARSIGMGRDGDGSRLMNCCDGVEQTCAGDSITVATRRGIPHGPEQAGYIGTCTVWVEQGQKMAAALHRELHAGKQDKGPEAWPGLLLHPLVGRLQAIDPIAAVVVGDRDAVDTGGHELTQPALWCHLLVSADGLLPGAGV